MPVITQGNCPRTPAELAKRLNVCHKAIKSISDAVDAKRMDKANVKYDKSELVPGQKVFIFRPESAAAKRDNLKWIGPYEVVYANELTAKLKNPRSGALDYVSRHHIKVIPKQPTFNPYDDVIDDEEYVPSGGGVTGQVPVDLETEQPPKTEVTKRKRSRKKKDKTTPRKRSKNSNATPIDADSSRTGTGRPIRQRTQTKRLQLDPSAKSYE